MENGRDDSPVLHDHRRQWRDCLYVYPVISRRSKGLSIGVNLNPEKRCTFSCVYCQVDRHIRRELHAVDIDRLRAELELALGEAVSGAIWRDERFSAVPEQFRRINDIAFSGDGEPTCLANFDQAVQAAAEAKGRFGLEGLKLVVITNATQMDSPQFTRALPILDSCNGEIWAKLDAGTDEFFQTVNRPQPMVPLSRVVENIKQVARGREIVIQSLFFRFEGEPPLQAEVVAYCNRLNEIIGSGGRIKLIQIYTVAREPAEASVEPLGDGELEAIAGAVRAAVRGMPVETFYGRSVWPQKIDRQRMIDSDI